MAVDVKQAKAIFLDVVHKVPVEQWSSYVPEACGADAELAANVQRLLEAHLSERALATAAVESVAAHVALPFVEQTGAQIGPYKLLQVIGEGGMGVVYMAEQTEPVERRVALKIIKPGMDSRQVIARFEAERQALALMDHPNIARVLDAGTVGPGRRMGPNASSKGENSRTVEVPGEIAAQGPAEPSGPTGRPYFVMELVKGVPITKYCDEKHLSLQERLELMIPVCQAIQHAHQKGIIHRDIKPSNVLVAQYDGWPVPKVIDFGIAKATAQKLTERTMFTELGQVVGTLEYMSPEQAELNQLDIDTRSDIYSLGVLLYELLTGYTPFDKQKLRTAAFAEMLRIIREEEPPKPSTKLSTIDTLPSVAINRSVEPARLSKAIRGELDWIVMKALEKDRNRRYETANVFAADIQRYLADEPVQACPPSAGYRFRKFAKKHRAVFATATIVAASLLLGTGLSLWQAIRATAAEAQAVANESRAKAEEHKAKSEEQKAIAAAEAERTAKEAEAAQRRQAEKNFATALQAVDRVMVRLVSSELREFPQLQPVSQRVCKDALELYGQLQSEFGDSPEIDFRIARAIYLSDENKQPPEVRKANFQRAVTLLEPLVQRFPDNAEYWRTLAECCYDAQKFFGDSRGNNPELHAAMAQRCLEADERLASLDPAAAKCDGFGGRRTLAIFALYDLTRKRGEATEAQELLDRGIQMAEGLEDPVGGCLWRLLFAKSELPQLNAVEQEEYCWRALEQLRQWSERQTHASATSTPGDAQSVSALPQWVPFTHKRGRAWLADTLNSLAQRFGSRNPEKAEALLHESSGVRRSVVSKYPWDPYLRGLYENSLLREAAFLRGRANAQSTAQEKAAKLAQAGAVLDEAVRNARQRLYLVTAQGKKADEQDRELAAPQQLVSLANTLEQNSNCVMALCSVPGAVPADQRIRVTNQAASMLAEAVDIFRRLAAVDDGYKSRLTTLLKLQAEVALAPLRERAVALEKAGSFAEAEAAWREALAASESQLGADHLETRTALLGMGQILRRQKKLGEAEVFFRRAMTADEKWRPDSWSTFNLKSSSGDLLLSAARELARSDPAAAQKKFREAEALLLEGYKGMIAHDEGHPPAGRHRQRSGAIRRLIDLYDAWDKPIDGAKWRAELEALEKEGQK